MKKLPKTQRKLNRKERNKKHAYAMNRAEKRFNGAVFILSVLSRGAPIVGGAHGVFQLQQTYGI